YECYCTVFTSRTPRLILLRCVSPLVISTTDILWTIKETSTVFLTREHLTITWNKMGSKGFVYRIRNNKHLQEEQDPTYANRTEVSPSINNGTLQASLNLQNAFFHDEGIYICSFSTLERQAKDEGRKVMLNASHSVLFIIIILAFDIALFMSFRHLKVLYRTYCKVN
uniref:Ig-like domain-containing protein n=1 Tax=Callorhinchus milii TaxID=7868 RepID=A0A4W3GGQ9_CALMI